MINNIRQMAATLQAAAGPFECIKRYRRPPAYASLGENLRWIIYRVWNAIKSIFGQSDWQIAKRDIKGILLNTRLFTPSSAESTAESILTLCTEGRVSDALRIIENLFQSSGSRGNQFDQRSSCLIS